MKARHLIFILGSFLLVAIALILPGVLSRARENAEIKQISTTLRARHNQIVAATEAFARDQTRNITAKVPTQVSLQDLIADGYLRAQDFPGLKPVQAIARVFAETNNIRPQDTLVRVRRSAGHDIVLAIDGSTYLAAH